MAVFSSLKKQRSGQLAKLPLRTDILNVVQMEKLAKSLAKQHAVCGQEPVSQLLSRLAENEEIIKSICMMTMQSAGTRRQTRPVAEWLTDNFYLIEEKIRKVRKSLSVRYDHCLPCVQKGNAQSLPRAYEIAAQIISHTDARIECNDLTKFIAAYQSITPLLLAELWALPVMLELALIENLRRIADRMVENRDKQDNACLWADRMAEAAEKAPSDVVLVIADMARSHQVLDGAFVAELARCLQDQGSSLAAPLQWIDQRLSQSFASIEQVVHAEIQSQAADQVSISNSIGSLRTIGIMDWKTFVESLSLVEQALRLDPAGTYARMDFETRNHYRMKIESLARKSPLPEVDVAKKALELAHKTAADDTKAKHIGYFLVGDGIGLLEKEAQVRLSLVERTRKSMAKNALLLFVGAAAILAAVLTMLLAFLVFQAEIPAAGKGILIFLSFISFTRPAMDVINWLSVRTARPAMICGLDFSSGIPADARTLVAVPILLTDKRGMDDICAAMEARYLANRGPNIYFCLLSDFPDADGQTLPSDAPLLDYAGKKINELNKKYVSTEDIFFFFHRPRLWNEQEKVWMGYERKRGKINALNMFLRKGDSSSFSFTTGGLEALENIKYVIALDADTKLPRDAARRLAGAMAHPLNRPRRDEKTGIITEGYGILQPSMVSSLPAANASLYARFFCGAAGVDPYTRLVSNIYQDIFGEGSFVGKGIYDIDAFEEALEGRLPENRILSHDLLEGGYARAGFISNIQFYDDYPPSYKADSCRNHRWIRGDWQVASWILPRVPGPGNAKYSNPLSGLTRWKIFDNLRRSLVSPAFLMFLLCIWTLFPRPELCSLAAILIFFGPSFCIELFNLETEDIPFGQLVSGLPAALGKWFLRTIFYLSTLPHEAFYHMDAICRAIWRMQVSHSRLLEWTPSNETNGYSNKSLIKSYKHMWFPPLLAVLTLFFFLFLKPSALPASGCFLALWLLSPAFAWKLSRPLSQKLPELTDDQKRFLDLLSRRIWAFFEKHVGPEDNWLPPDNMQEQPVAIVAHRTSPTNMGLALLANLSAWDFGYITPGQFLARTGHTLGTMEKLPRYRNHFYNWYSTESLAPLNPLYISSVDSGNLAGHLITLRQGLFSLPSSSVLPVNIFEGLRATFTLFEQASGDTECLKTLKQKLSVSPAQTVQATTSFLKEIALLAGKSPAGDTHEESFFWREAFLRQCRDALGELALLAPWSDLAAPVEWLRKNGLDAIPSLKEVASYGAKTLILEDRDSLEEKAWAHNVQNLLKEASAAASRRLAEIERLARIAEEMSFMDFSFLHDPANCLLSIGFSISNQKRDAACYDLLASEARLAYFIAIAQGQLPETSWFSLGRQLADAGQEPALVSWSGSVFEYLMPLLVMPDYDGSLLHRTSRAIVNRHKEYGMQKGVPWGISESGYNMFDGHLNYQYRAFGVPGLGLKRGLGEDLVIAPYASIMALMVAPRDACLNLQRMVEEEFNGIFGFYEAVDYTPSRLVRGRKHALIRSFMAHHQGMAFLSLNHLLMNRLMQKRFAADPLFEASALMLQEITHKKPLLNRYVQEVSAVGAGKETGAPIRVLGMPAARPLEVQLLSNGRYHVMVTNAGGCYSRWNEFALTRWREDAICDNWGQFCYIRDRKSGAYWSATLSPTEKKPQQYEAIFSEGKAEFRRREGNIEVHTEIVVSPEDDVEIRRSRITNLSQRRKLLDVTSYAEVVMAPQAADISHPAFSNLFVQTEVLKEDNAILCRRRPRSVQEHPPHMFHMMHVHDDVQDGFSFETSRMRFIGRRRTVAAPHAMSHPGPMNGIEGSVLDPVVAIRRDINLAPGQSVVVDFITGAGDSREKCATLIKKYKDIPLADRVFEMSWTHGQAILRQLNVTESEAQLFNRLASAIVYSNSGLRAETEVLMKNSQGQSGLWRFGISGDLPIILLRIKDVTHIDLVRRLIRAQHYWRLKGLIADLVIWNEDRDVYRQTLQDQIIGSVTGSASQMLGRAGGIFIQFADQISTEDRFLIEAVAHVVIDDAKGPLEAQIRRRVRDVHMPEFMPTSLPMPMKKKENLKLPQGLLFFNGLGGFTPDGREYAVMTEGNRSTPLPWVNVIANPDFGFVVSESGQSYTWSENAHEFRLTPWSNDPVTDHSGEAIYLRDEESGEVWSPAPLPAPTSAPYITRHGFGYSVFEHRWRGIKSEMTVYAALNAPVKFIVLKVHNLTDDQRQLSATGYVEWVLGETRSKTGRYIVTEIDKDSGALLARNSYNKDFPGRIAFFDVDEKERSVTGDRIEFLGRNGRMQKPVALSCAELSGRTGIGLESCGAIQVYFDLEPGEEREIIFRLGVAAQGESESLSHWIRSLRGAEFARTALEKVRNYWNDTLGAMQIETPDKALDFLVNGWLMYQTMACRLWARSGYYQSGGAFGFRDQLQDAMALVYAKPEMLREQILLCARHQFAEGDVQHWWHPPSGRGVRTKCSDDYLWLPQAVSRYISATGDSAILEEEVPFIEGRLLNQDEESCYDLPLLSSEKASLYEHCRRSIMHGLRFGAHQLPLMGSGDWNDGMDRIGEHGKGESVWLAFFLYDILQKFSSIAAAKGDEEFVRKCRGEAAHLRQAIEANAWDGSWYRRAYFDDGQPLGTAGGEECQIDSISQSWSVLSGAAETQRAQQALQSAYTRLVHPGRHIVQLLDPPFDKSALNPGYIRGYVPGVRENGGQYTHAAIWLAMALAQVRENKKAWEILRIINPLKKTETSEGTEVYKAEPYVLAADVYGMPPHEGRGGWTWYTGSSGWMYRLIVEDLLGLRLRENTLSFQPCLPPEWKQFKISYRYHEAVYEMAVEVVDGAEGARVVVDGALQADEKIHLARSGRYQVSVQVPC